MYLGKLQLTQSYNGNTGFKRKLNEMEKNILPYIITIAVAFVFLCGGFTGYGIGKYYADNAGSGIQPSNSIAYDLDAISQYYIGREREYERAIAQVESVSQRTIKRLQDVIDTLTDVESTSGTIESESRRIVTGSGRSIDIITRARERGEAAEN
jgi:hypothetical protein